MLRPVFRAHRLTLAVKPHDASMFFQDLTPYEYFEERPPALNIGWFDSAHSFTRGGVPDGFVARLRSLARQPVNQIVSHFFCKKAAKSFAINRGLVNLQKVWRTIVNQTRGFHVCQFCDFGPAVADADQSAWNERYQQWRDADALSSAEIRVAGRDGRVYTSPMLICHYVEAHGYQPPLEFVEAVMEMEDDPVA